MALQLRLPLLSLAAALAVAAAHADPLTPGGVVVAPGGASLGTNPWLSGTVVADVITPFAYLGWYVDNTTWPVAAKGLVQGSVESKVIRTDAGTYDFYWRVTTSGNSFLPVESLRLRGFAPGSFDANWRADGPEGVVPALAQEDISGEIKWAFGQYLPPSTEIYPGQTSVEFFLATSATGYSASGTFSLESARDSGGDIFMDWGGHSKDFATFAPLQAVPEPASILLSLLGLPALVLARRRRAA